MDAQPRPNPLRAAVVFGIVQGVVWMGVCVAFIQLAPGFERVFADFKVDLPELTKRFIQLDHFLHQYWWLAIPLVLVWALANVGVVVALGLSPTTFSRFCKWTWCVLASLAPLAFMALATLAYIVPMEVMLDSFGIHK